MRIHTIQEMRFFKCPDGKCCPDEPAFYEPGMAGWAAVFVPFTGICIWGLCCRKCTEPLQVC